MVVGLIGIQVASQGAWRFESSRFRMDMDIYYMTNVRPEKTGLNMVIYISPKFSDAKPDIKVSKTFGNKVGEYFSMLFDGTVNGDTGDIKPKDIERIKRFVEKNIDALMKLWNDEIDPADAVNQFIKVD